MTYGSFAGFTAYHVARNHDIAAYDEDDVNAALLVGTKSLDGRYRNGFAGEKTARRDQDDEWPRTGAYDENGDPIDTDEIPVEAEYATYELALQELISPGSLSVNYTPSAYQSVSVDGAVSVTYADRSDVSDAQTKFAIVDEIIGPLLVMGGSGYSGKVVR